MIVCTFVFVMNVSVCVRWLCMCTLGHFLVCVSVGEDTCAHGGVLCVLYVYVCVCGCVCL